MSEIQIDRESEIEYPWGNNKIKRHKNSQMQGFVKQLHGKAAPQTVLQTSTDAGPGAVSNSETFWENAAHLSAAFFVPAVVIHPTLFDSYNS